MRISLIENRPHSIPFAQLSFEDEALLAGRFTHVLDCRVVGRGSTRTWQLTNRGWVGQIPLPSGIQLNLEPKTKLRHLFLMLQTAYRIPKSIWAMDGRAEVKAESGWLDRLAGMLLDLVESKIAEGLLRPLAARVTVQETIQGRIDFRRTLSQAVPTRHALHLARADRDVPLNQLIGYTMAQIALADWCSSETGRRADQCARRLPVPAVRPTVKSDYSRLSESYRPIHQLCELICDGLIPDVGEGEAVINPFLIYLPTLFERFVTEWTQANLSNGLSVIPQERISIADGERHIAIDLVVYNEEGAPLAVIDTKYKRSDRIELQDIYQVTFYAHQIGATRAWLVYPEPVERPLSGTNHDVEYNLAAFNLGHDDLNRAGQLYLNEIGLGE